ncbi:TPA: alpha-2,8-polysialyltransferase family protein [Neisseria meningitidis]|nr:alpha-2,8-polysialyltransferase family protein [Neisseria meningitidis]
MLKKIKKALFQPKKFFQDSMWLTTSPFYLTPPRNNLFVISNLGQLNQVQSLIKIQKLTNNLLVILYTSKNLKMPKLVHQSANKNLFESIYLFELPRSPNNITPKKLLYIYRSYKKILNIIQPTHLYMLSFTGHYSYLISIAKKKEYYDSFN